MNKRSFLALANIVLLVLFSFFAWDRYQAFKLYFVELGMDFDIVHILRTMKHDVLILVTGLLSLVGILFWSNKKVFFFVSTFYAAILLVLLLLLRSINVVHIIMALAEMLFLWLLIWKNTFSVFENRRWIKLLFLLIGVVIYELIAKLIFKI